MSEHDREQAEAARVVAEEHRANSRVVAYRRIAVLIALPLALVAMIPGLVGYIGVKRQADNLASEVHNRCHDAAVNRSAIRATLINSFKNLGYTYDEETGHAVVTGPPLDYYLAHPEEREAQLQAALNTIRLFPPINCNS